MKNYPILWEKDPYESTRKIECHKGFGSCDDVSASRLPPASQACWCRFTAVDFPVMASWMAFWWIGVDPWQTPQFECRSKWNNTDPSGVELGMGVEVETQFDYVFWRDFWCFFAPKLCQCSWSDLSIQASRNFPHPFRHLKKRQETWEMLSV